MSVSRRALEAERARKRDLRREKAVEVPAWLMKRLRRDVRGRKTRQEDVARMLNVSLRVITLWETEGTRRVNAWAYVGLAYRFGNADRALSTLAQAELPGSDVWARKVRAARVPELENGGGAS